MIVKRKLYSVIDEEGNLGYYLYNESTGEEKLFSVVEEQREFGEKKGKKVNLEEVESHKGLKRAIITAIPTGGGSLSGGYLSKSEADKLDKEGASDEEIIRKAKKHGLKVGAITGTAVGGLTSIYSKNTLPLIAIPLGALGGRNAAGVNVKDRLAKRAIKERELNRED